MPLDSGDCLLRISVIESLGNEDWPDGDSDGEFLRGVLPEASVDAVLVGNLAEFAGALGRIVGPDSRQTDDFVVHLAAHGDEYGLRLTDGSNVSWEGLGPLLADVNRRAAGNLGVFSSACVGGRVARALVGSPAAPFCWMFGTECPVSAQDLRKGAPAFYSELMASGDPPRAGTAFRRASGADFLLLTADLIRFGYDAWPDLE